MLTRLLIPARRVWLSIALIGVALLGFGLYLQHVVGLEPCPMCIVQRYVLILITLVALMGGVLSSRYITGGVLLLLCGGGAFVAARQSWLQWYPPEVMTCGRDFYGMIEAFPLGRAIPMIFRGGGDCAQVDWTFLGGSIANWSFVCFVALGLLTGLTLAAHRRPSLDDSEAATHD
jgi:protein dithiol:quinone oxidoreductase